MAVTVNKPMKLATHENPNRVAPWNITQLALEYSKDLLQCQTATERTCCAGIYRTEIKDLLATIHRKLTPGEEAVLADFGITQ